MSLLREVVGVDVDSNFRALSGCQDQTGTKVPLVIFGTHTFLTDEDAMTFIRLLPSAQDKQRAQQEVAEILRQRQEIQGEQCEIWHSFFMQEKTWSDVGKSTSWGEESYRDIGEFGKSHRQYRNELERTIFREWGTAGKALIVGQAATNVCLLKSLALQHTGTEGLEKIKTMLN